MSLMQSHWKRTGAPPRTYAGHEFLVYHVGIQRYVAYCAAIDAYVQETYNYSGYHANVAGHWLLSPRTGKTHRFAREKTAALAAIAHAAGSLP